MLEGAHLHTVVTALEEGLGLDVLDRVLDAMAEALWAQTTAGMQA